MLIVVADVATNTSDWKKSIPQTRLRLARMMIGLETESGEDEWENEGEGGGKRGKDEKNKRIRRDDGNVKRKIAGTS